MTRNHQRLVLVSGVVLLVFILQLSRNFVIGADGYLHGAMARMILDKGYFLSSFPQAYYSWFKDRFSDKDFLYHIYLIPFISIFGLFLGLKIAAATATSFLFGITTFIITENKNRITWIIAGGLFLSAQFMRDTMEPRPLVIAIFLTVLGIWIMKRNNPKTIFIISLIYGMLHLSAWIYPTLILFYGVYLWLDSEKFPFKTWIFSAVGFLLSFIFHPNFPNNIFYFYLNGIVVPYLAARTGVLELGAEFFPVLTSDIIKLFPFGLLLGMSVFALIIMVKEKSNQQSVSWFLGGLVFGFMALTSKRHLTHMYPLILIFLASEMNTLIMSLKNLNRVSRDRFISVIIPVMAIIVIFSFYQTLKTFPQMMQAEKVYAYHFSRISEDINKKIPQGSIIFHSNWSDSQYLIGMAPNYRYFVTLDPIYMYSFNQKMYQLYRDVSFGRVNNPYEIFHEIFKSNYGYIGKNYFNDLIKQIKSDKRFQIIYEDQLGILYKII